MKRFQRFVIIVLFLLVAVLTYGLELRDKYVVPILVYHEIKSVDPRDVLLNVTVRNFEAQMSYLKRHNYHVISLDELVASRGKGRAPAHHSIVLTFDGGYEDVYTRAFPVLKQYGFPATVFLVVRLVGKKGYLTWDQIKEMEKSGIIFGSHAITHAALPARGL